MTATEWAECCDVTAMLAFVREFVPDSVLLTFGCACCRSVAHLCPEPEWQQLFACAEKRASGQPYADELRALDAAHDALYNRLYPGHGAPSPATLALVAVGEAVSTLDVLRGVTSAAQTAARAFADAQGDLEPDDFDIVRDAAWQTINKQQAEQLRALCATYFPPAK